MQGTVRRQRISVGPNFSPTSKRELIMAIGATGFHQTRWNWVDAIGTEPLGFSPEVTTIDGRADWRNIMGSNVDFGLWIKNATDKRYSLGGVALSSTVGTVTYVYSEPRTYGADIRYSFGK